MIILCVIAVAILLTNLGIYFYTKISCRKKSKEHPQFYIPENLYIGDLHCHSIYSGDGVFSVKQIINYAKGAGLDFLAITDHNENKSMNDDPKDAEVTMLQGSECSLDESCGHFNVLGIEDIELAPDMLEKDEIIAYMNRMKAKGARIQINHPFANTLGWSVGWDVPYDYIEVWNRSYNETNQQAVDFWNELLCQGRRITATGGTDAHYEKSERYPLNGVYAKECTSDDILAALDRGHSFVTECAYGPWIQLKSGESIMGDEISADETTELEIFVEHIELGYTVSLLSDKGELFKETTDVKSYYKKITGLTGTRFFRVEVRRANGVMAALSNPIYVMTC